MKFKKIENLNELDLTNFPMIAEGYYDEEYHDFFSKLPCYILINDKVKGIAVFDGKKDTYLYLLEVSEHGKGLGTKLLNLIKKHHNSIETSCEKTELGFYKKNDFKVTKKYIGTNLKDEKVICYDLLWSK